MKTRRRLAASHKSSNKVEAVLLEATEKLSFLKLYEKRRLEFFSFEFEVVFFI